MKRALLLLALLYAANVSAMATIEFMKMKSTDQYDIVKPIMLGFLQSGCKNVPDNPFRLIGVIEKIAYAKGYTYQNVETVAKEAALSLGMTC